MHVPAPEPPRTEIGIPREVWRRIAASPARVLLIDYDGTLAPFATDGVGAGPSPRALAALSAIAARDGDAVVVVSGRPISELEPLLPALAIDRIGEHGWEERRASGDIVSHTLEDEAAEHLRLAWRAAQSAGWERWVQAKRASLVLHVRGVDREIAEPMLRGCRHLWASFAVRDGLTLDETIGGLELRAAARHKGMAVTERMRRAPADALAVYLGDDHADEHAFRALAPLGITIRVGAEDRPSAAQWRLRSVEDVTTFLETWRDLPGAALPPPAS